MWKVFVLSLARAIGSASFLLAPGYLSTSSMNKNRMGLLARLDGELEPARLRYIPSNCSSSFEDSLSLNLAFRVGDALNIGFRRLAEMLSARVSVG